MNSNYFTALPHTLTRAPSALLGCFIPLERILLVLQELDIHAFPRLVLLGLGSLDTISVVLERLVVVGVVLGLGHFGWLGCYRKTILIGLKARFEIMVSPGSQFQQVEYNGVCVSIQGTWVQNTKDSWTGMLEKYHDEEAKQNTIDQYHLVNNVHVL